MSGSPISRVRADLISPSLLPVRPDGGLSLERSGVVRRLSLVMTRDGRSAEILRLKFTVI